MIFYVKSLPYFLGLWHKNGSIWLINEENIGKLFGDRHVFGDGQRCYPSPGLARAAKCFKRGQGEGQGGKEKKLKNPQHFGWLTILQHYLTYASNPVSLGPHSCPPPKKFPPPPIRYQ
jgi:hypothetical protein